MAERTDCKKEKKRKRITNKSRKRKYQKETIAGRRQTRKRRRTKNIKVELHAKYK